MARNTTDIYRLTTGRRFLLASAVVKHRFQSIFCDFSDFWTSQVLWDNSKEKMNYTRKHAKIYVSNKFRFRKFQVLKNGGS